MALSGHLPVSLLYVGLGNRQLSRDIVALLRGQLPADAAVRG